MTDSVVTFKSSSEMFEKEKSGRKPNTVRKIDAGDDRFASLRAGCGRIVIVASHDSGDRSESFEREITDYSEWEGLAVISWKHDDCISMGRVRDEIDCVCSDDETFQGLCMRHEVQRELYEAFEIPVPDWLQKTLKEQISVGVVRREAEQEDGGEQLGADPAGKEAGLR